MNSATVRGGDTAAHGGTPPAEPPLLERDRELIELRTAIGSAQLGEGRIVLLEGAAGLGKTALLTWLAREAAERGMTVLRARGGELERQFPLGVALQLFEPHVSSLPSRERRRVLAGAAAHAAPLLVGGERARRPSGPPEFPLLHGLHWVAANLAEERPLLLAVDDAHTADDASMRALLYTAQRCEDLPLAIVVAARPQTPSDGGGDALTAIATHALTRRIELGGLSDGAIAELVRARLPQADAAFCAACARVTSGNPLFARELIGELVDADVAPTAEQVARVGNAGPTSIARAIGARLDRLAPGATPLAHAVAVLGDATPLAHAAELAVIDPEEARVAADELAAADVLRPAADLGFVHPVVRQTVYLSIPSARRAQLHLDAARLLRRLDGVERAAPHLLQTLPTGAAWVVDCLHAGARRALAGGAPETAAQYLVRALDEAPPDAERAALLIDLGSAEARAGLPTAIERLREAVALLDQPQARARALAQLGQALYAAGDNAAAATAFDEGLRILGDADPVLEEELTAGYLSVARLDFRTREAALTRFGDLLSGSAEATTAAQRELLAQRALEHAMLGSEPHDEVVRLLGRAHGDGAMLREATADGVAWVGSVAALLFSDALREVEAATTAGLEDARARGSVVGFAAMSTVRGAGRYLRGEVASALADLEGGLEPLPVMTLVRPFALGFKGLAHIDRGELELAQELLAALDEEEPSAHFTYNWTLFARARLALVQGDPARAYELLRDCGARQEAIPAPNPAVLPWRSEAAVAAFKLDREAEALELVGEELERTRAFGAPRALGTALRAAGLVTRGPAGIALLEEAVLVLAGSPAALGHARALLDLGATRRRAGQQGAARETLRYALDAAYHCDAPGLCALARAELVAAGARPRRQALRGTAALTPSELRVAELAQRGLTNREIAQALFVSTKTVEFHLRNAYLKLGIGSRRELSRALGRDAP